MNLYTFEIDLADADRGVYETLALRVARHPSETEDFLVTRVLAYCLEYQQGIEFSRGGLSEPDDPAIAVRDLTGSLVAWIDIGTPAADRLHRAAKSARRVAVYMHKEGTQWLAGLAASRIHRADEIELRVVDRALIAALVARLDRRVSFALSVAQGEVFASFSDTTLSGRVEPLRIG
ncbi:MAG TPA: YaeQ family protein [Vicinamibacterales bacterium]|nr:YaeQ family protein [Vicinamibacterales bacterium]